MTLEIQEPHIKDIGFYLTLVELPLTHFGKTMGGREFRGNDSESSVGQVV